MDEYISIRMESYLTLNFMRHWIIENWHMYNSIATAESGPYNRQPNVYSGNAHAKL